MKYPRILAALRSARWAVTPATLQAISDSLGAHMRGVVGARPPLALIPDRPGPPATEPGDEEDDDMVSEGVAIVRVHGIIGKHLSALEMECGGCDVECVRHELIEAMEKPNVHTVILDIDSPGGVVTGTPELADTIRQFAQIKKIVAFTGGQCCSAAYWIASACDAIYCTKSADLGSIGVYVALCDDSEWWKREGYKLELIKAGTYKAMGISGQPLAPDERAMIQKDVDAIYAMFTADVRAGRGMIDGAYMQGQMFMGSAAVEARLADEVVGDLESVIVQAERLEMWPMPP